jgi:hypothetical protein
VFDEGRGLSTQAQQYDHTAIINAVRQQVDQWRSLPNPHHWQVTPETARLLQHWRHHQFSNIRPFFCQVESIETVVWLTEVAPNAGKAGNSFLEHLANANHDANPELMRLALKLATGAGKTTVMAMLIAWQTIHQIRTQADRLLGPELSDIDGNTEQWMGTISVFNGPRPTIQVFQTPEDESQKVGTWLSDRANYGVMPHEMGVFVRSPAEVDRARAAVGHAGLPFTVLDEHVETTSGHVSISTMHLAKGLEFRAVAVMACDDEVIPLQARIETVANDADLEEVYNTEGHLLYVACTRARDHLLVTSVDPPSEFLDDLRM